MVESNPQSDNFKPTSRFVYPQFQESKQSATSLKGQVTPSYYTKEAIDATKSIFSQVEQDIEKNLKQFTSSKLTSSTKMPPGLDFKDDSESNIRYDSKETSFSFSEISNNDPMFQDLNPNTKLFAQLNPNQPESYDSKWDPFIQYSDEKYDQNIFPSEPMYKPASHRSVQRKGEGQPAQENQQLQPQIFSHISIPTPSPLIIFKQYPDLHGLAQEPEHLSSNDPVNECYSRPKMHSWNPSTHHHQAARKNHKSQTISAFEMQSSHDQIESMLKIISTSVDGASKFLYELCAQLKKQKPTVECVAENNQKQTTFVACMRVGDFCGFGEGKSKQEAKNCASKELLRLLAHNDVNARKQLRVLTEKDKPIVQMNKPQNLPGIIRPHEINIAKPMKQQKHNLHFEDEELRNSVDFPHLPAYQDNDFAFENKIRSQSMKNPFQMSALKRRTSVPMRPEEFDSIAILNELSIDNKIPTFWDHRTEGEGYISELTFGPLPKFVGFGSRKKESQREAATKLYVHLIANENLRALYLRTCEERKLQKGIALPNPDVLIMHENERKSSKSNLKSEQQASQFSLDHWMWSNVFLELKSHLQGIDGGQYKDQIDRHLVQKLKALCFSDEERTSFDAFCDYVSKLIEKAASAGKSAQSKLNQISMNDIVRDMSLFPLGSYALDHLRRDHPIADFSLVYEPQVKENTMKNASCSVLGRLYECLKSDNEAISASRFNLDVKLENIDDGGEIKASYVFLKDKNSGFGIRIFATKKPNFMLNTAISEDQGAILHVAKMSQLLKKHENLREDFNNCCLLLKHWRRKGGLASDLRSEIIDLAIFDLLSNFQVQSPGAAICQILQTFTDQEATIQVLLKYSESIANSFKKLKAESVSIIQKESKKSLKNLCDERYLHANF